MSRLMGQILIEEAPVWGIRLAKRADKLVIAPASKCPPELRELLRANKAEILSLLEAEADGLAPDQAPWLHVAKQVLLSEFDKAEESAREAVFIGLRSIGHPLCRRAVEKLNLLQENRQ